MEKPTGKLKAAYDTIARQQIKIDKLDRQIERLQDECNRRSNWIYEAKQSVGVPSAISFDNIWKRVKDLFNDGKIDFKDI